MANAVPAAATASVLGLRPRLAAMLLLVAWLAFAEEPTSAVRTRNFAHVSAMLSGGVGDCYALRHFKHPPLY